MTRRLGLDAAAHRPLLRALERRMVLRGALSLGAVSLLSGCDLADDDTTDRILLAMSRWNDRVQAALFSRTLLAPTYPASEITEPFPFNAFYPIDRVPQIDGTSWRLAVRGLAAERRDWSLADLRRLPQESQITRHICVEGWSAIGQWGGVPFRTFLDRVGADPRARYVGFTCADDYSTSIDMATARHPQTLLVLDYAGAPLPPKFGFPIKIRIPTKLGFKNPKHVVAITITNDYPGGYWEDQGYNWFSGS